MIIEISIAFIAVGFLGLVIYLILFLNDLRKLTKRVNGVLLTIEPHLDELAEEAARLTQTSQIIALDIQKKLEAVNSIVKSASDLGEVVEHHTSLYKKKCEHKLALREEPETCEKGNKIDAIVDLVELGIIFFQTFKKRS